MPRCRPAGKAASRGATCRQNGSRLVHGNRSAIGAGGVDHPSEHDPEKACPGLDPGWKPVFGKDHAPIKHLDREPIKLIGSWSSGATAPAAVAATAWRILAATVPPAPSVALRFRYPRARPA